jgi:branched-chain amino acid transport system substrate-binding protein
VGVPRECFESTNIAPTNQGPRLSSIGAAQYMNEKYGATKFVCMALNIPNFGNWSCDGMAEWGKTKGIKVDQVIFDPASMDPTSLVLQAAAFNPDAIITTMPAQPAQAILKAAEQQDMGSKFHWFGPTSLYDLAFPAAVGSYWENHLDVQIELANIDSTGPDNTNWLKVMDKYGDAKDPRDSFSQAGFLAAKIFTDTALKLDPTKVSRDTITEALKAVKGYKSDLICGSWYFGPGDTHNANHAGRMVQLTDGGKWKVTKDCFEVEDPALAPILQLEKSQGLTQ